MSELGVLVARTRNGDLDAFGEVVRRFQDMALAYAYSLLGDFHLAEDAAQEAFLQAYRDLEALREPAAFPGWFRKIVFKHCDRIKRARRLPTVPLDEVYEIADQSPGPQAVAECREMRESVLVAIRSLPQNERTVTTLFYINGYTQKDVAEFLELPVTTVNNRLHASRALLKERMVQMVDDELKTHGMPEDFPERIKMLLELPRPLEIDGHPVKRMWTAFSSCFPDFQKVELGEVWEQQAWMNDDILRERAHKVSDRTILRFEMTSQMVNYWIGNGGGPCRLMSVGRVFRADEVSRTKLEVFHQAEVLWAEEGLDMQRLNETLRRVADSLLPGIESRPGAPFDDYFLGEATTYVAPWRGRWIGIAGGGIAKDEWLVKAGLDPSRYGVVSFGFGLERCAQIAMDLDDIHVLWRPPYVAE